MQSKSDNLELMIGDNADKVIEDFFRGYRRSRY